MRAHGLQRNNRYFEQQMTDRECMEKISKEEGRERGDTNGFEV
jgi:hypothetical protein